MMKRSVQVMVLFGVLLTAAVGCSRSDTGTKAAAPAQATPEKAGPTPAARGLDAEGHLQISQGDRCPVCGMEVKAHSKFAAGVALSDGRTFYTCGTGCLVRSHLHPERYLNAGKDQLEREVVQEYLGGRQIDALEAVWVAGSDVVGPMGPAVVPLASEDDAKIFRERHGGKATFRLGELTPARWDEITGRKAGHR